ncbi:MAG: sulfatase-like hydrolase/transferase [Anaerolineae bacterium]
MAKKPNLVLITIDSLRADHLGCLGYGEGVSPRIDRLAAQGTLFRQAIANGPRSPASFPALLASIYLSSAGGHGIPPGTVTLAEALRREGYATAGFCGGNPYISSYFGYDQGFDLFRDFLAPGAQKGDPGPRPAGRRPLKKLLDRILGKNALHDPAFLLFAGTLRGKKNVADTSKSETEYPFEAGEELNRQATAWLDSLAEGPFFLWLHYMDVHFPHLPRVPRHRPLDYGRFALALAGVLLRRYSFPRRVMIDLYDDRIRDTDRIVGQLLAQLQTRGLEENTLIALTADHGEEFLEHGGWGHGAKLYDELLRVPLIVKGPGLAPGEVVEQQIGLVDLPPTLLDLLGIKGRGEAFEGASFLPRLVKSREDGKGPHVFSEALHLGGRRPPFWEEVGAGKPLYRIRSCRTGDWKYIWDEEGDQEELYNLSRDSREAENVATHEPEMARQLASVLADHFSRFTAAGPAAGRVPQRPLSAEEEQEIVHRLRGLGYY